MLSVSTYLRAIHHNVINMFEAHREKTYTCELPDRPVMENKRKSISGNWYKSEPRYIFERICLLLQTQTILMGAPGLKYWTGKAIFFFYHLVLE